MHAYKKNSNGDHIGGCLFFPNLHNHLQVKVHFDFQKKKEEKGHVQSLSKPISGCGTCCWKCHICTLCSAKPLGA